MVGWPTLTEGDLDLGAAGIAHMGAVLVNDGLLLLSG